MSSNKQINKFHINLSKMDLKHSTTCTAETSNSDCKQNINRCWHQNSVSVKKKLFSNYQIYSFYYTYESFIAVMHVRSALMHEHNNAAKCTCIK